MAATTRTPLALAVLSLLLERPMHPYEMQTTMRERGHDAVINLKGASVYDAVERLIKAGLVAPQETTREGRRPERTVYALTDAGKDEHDAWLRELLGRPTPEFPRFAAGLAFAGGIPFEDFISELRQRQIVLEGKIAEQAAMHRTAKQMELPRLFLIEGEYLAAMLRAELKFVKGLIADSQSGMLSYPDEKWFQQYIAHVERQKRSEEFADQIREATKRAASTPPPPTLTRQPKRQTRRTK